MAEMMGRLLDQLPLKAATPPTWIAKVLQEFDDFLVDHAACERKASALAMSFVVRYADRPALVEPMICVAKEELAHFHEVYRLLHSRGLLIGPDEKDPYVTRLLSHVRHGRDEHLMDRLLVSGIIEARGCERFGLVAEALPAEDDLKQFYQRLAREEAGHYKVFLRIARHYFSDNDLEARLAELLAKEAEAMLHVPIRARVH